jgi:mannosyltransferase OCH1-like enzyme
MMPRILFQTWKSKADIPDHFRIWRETWIHNHPNWQHVFWDDQDNRAFISMHYAWFLGTYDAFPQEIFRADAVRYFFLYHYGGVYADMDFECLKPLDPLLSEVPQVVILGRMGQDPMNPHSIPNALMIAKTAGHPFWLHVISHLRACSLNSEPEACTGPVMLFHALRSYHRPSDIALMPPGFFYPIDWTTSAGQSLRRTVIRQGRLLTDSEQQLLFGHAYAVTYWAHSWQSC